MLRVTPASTVKETDAMSPMHDNNSCSVLFAAWHEKYSVGDPTIDVQHSELLDVIQALYVAAGEGKRTDVICDTLAALAMYIHEHLAFEERRLAEIGYPDLRHHVARHNEMRRWLRDIRHVHEVSVTNVTQEMIVFLRDWWVHHISKDDSVYSSYLRNHSQ